MLGEQGFVGGFKHAGYNRACSGDDVASGMRMLMQVPSQLSRSCARMRVYICCRHIRMLSACSFSCVCVCVYSRIYRCSVSQHEMRFTARVGAYAVRSAV
jgi:hypothetical protein